MALFKSTLGGTTPDGRWSFSIWTTNTGDDAAAALSKFQDAAEAMWVDGLDAFIATAVTYDSQSVVTINQATGQQIARADGIVSNPGVATAGTLPPQISLAVTLRTALATRAGRGRIYLPPFSLDEVAAGRLGGTTQGLALTAVKGMFDTMIADGHTPVLYGRSSHATTPVTQLALGDVYDTQRRRRDSYVESRVSTAV